jgi:hypothetical protein
MELQVITNIFSIVASLAIILSLPTALYQLIRALKSEQKSREAAVYNSLDDRYIEFQALCMQYPYLNIHDIPDETPITLNPKQKKQERIGFTFLLSIFERAYLMYLDQNHQLREAQWTGWDEYIHRACERETFREMWLTIEKTYDTRFVQYLNTIMQKQTPAESDAIAEVV